MTMLSKEGFEIYVKDLYTGQFPSGEAPGKLRALLAHDAEQRRVIEQQAQQIATLKSELSQRTNLEGSAPCWNSAHMRQIATLREALQGILEIGKRDMTNPKYDGYFEQAKQAIKEVKP